MAVSVTYPMIEGRVRTRSLEVHIVDHCNLRCAACCSLSPFLQKWLIDPADLARDLRLARKALAPTWFKLVGGEPLLHPAIDECLAIAREVQLAEIVSVTTNAFLLPRMSDRFWRVVDALTISLYPDPALPREIIALIETRASKNDVRLNWKRQNTFVQMDLTELRTDDEANRAIYAECWLRRRCHIVSRGRFYACTRPPHFQTLLGEGVDLIADGVLLDEGPDLASRIRTYLESDTPLATCARCAGGKAPSAQHRQLRPGEVRALRGQLR
jgi:MoaA/NifB/PqqE/SkfB family radical SAM enzyme